MKVLHIISGLRGGGAEHFVLELCRRSLKENEMEMKVLTLSANNEIAYKFGDAGVTVLSAHPGKKNRRGINAFSGFRILLKYPGKIVHAHMFHACMVACFAKLLRPSLSIILTLHNNNVLQLHRKVLLFLTRPLRKADVIFPGMQVKWYQKSDAVIIPNGIDPAKFVHLHTNKPPVFTCAFVGRLSEEKNPFFLIDLAKSLLPEHNFMIRVAGDGPLKKELIERIHDENLDDHFMVLGHIENVAELLASSHCLLIPSRWEGMPLVLLEAGACGIPVIATPVGNIPSLLGNNNGFVGDTGKFKELVIEVMDNYGDALIKARRLMQDVISHYNIDKAFIQHLEIYRH